MFLFAKVLIVISGQYEVLDSGVRQVDVDGGYLVIAAQTVIDETHSEELVQPLQY